MRVLLYASKRKSWGDCWSACSHEDPLSEVKPTIHFLSLRASLSPFVLQCCTFKGIPLLVETLLWEEKVAADYFVLTSQQKTFYGTLNDSTNQGDSLHAVILSNFRHAPAVWIESRPLLINWCKGNFDASQIEVKVRGWTDKPRSNWPRWTDLSIDIVIYYVYNL